MAAPSFSDLKTLGAAEVNADRPDLQLNIGDVADLLLAGAAAMADKNIQFTQDEIRKTFVETATGDDLTTLASDHFAIDRKPATPSALSVQFTRPSAGGGEPAGVIPAGTEIATVIDEAGNSVSFTTDVALAFALGELGPKSVDATAVNTGPESNVTANTVVRIVSSIAFDSTFAVTNPLEAAGGNNEETDEQLRDRIRNAPLTFARGTLAALEFGALQVPSVRVATATENILTGEVFVAVSDQSGNSNAQMVNDVIIELENWRCAGVNVSVVGATVLSADVTVTLTLAPGGSIAILSPSVVSNVEAEINRLGVGETLYNTAIIAAAKNVEPDLILDVDVSIVGEDASGDLVPTTNQLIRPGVTTVN